MKARIYYMFFILPYLILLGMGLSYLCQPSIDEEWEPSRRIARNMAIFEIILLTLLFVYVMATGHEFRIVNLT